MADCLFCKIIKGDIPSTKVYEDEDVLAFRDINPQAPEHILIIPKVHIDRVENLSDDQGDVAGKLVIAAKKIARQLGISNGYRLVFNNGPLAGQEVEHIHLHLLAGRKFSWPPG
ncbi:MAG: histidine triad nucleotide-binding protein [Candidatus Marinimicrobia bacterium]|nr:histidine triad nucleotide-binding protein [Candidatus Neomarinimicrobiota bacterium]